MGEKDATNDRLGRLAQVLGESDETISQCQLRLGQNIISAYQLPTQIVRYDTTSFNVHHQPDNEKNGILEFDRSKNHRPDLLQFKQGLATFAGLVPGNPKMKTTRPTAERLFSQFDNLHLLIQGQGKKISAVMVEGLTALQQKTLSILQMPVEIYGLSLYTEKRIRHFRKSETQGIKR